MDTDSDAEAESVESEVSFTSSTSSCDPGALPHGSIDPATHFICPSDPEEFHKLIRLKREMVSYQCSGMRVRSYFPKQRGPSVRSLSVSLIATKLRKYFVGTDHVHGHSKTADAFVLPHLQPEGGGVYCL